MKKKISSMILLMISMIIVILCGCAPKNEIIFEETEDYLLYNNRKYVYGHSGGIPYIILSPLKEDGTKIGVYRRYNNIYHVYLDFYATNEDVPFVLYTLGRQYYIREDLFKTDAFSYDFSKISFYHKIDENRKNIERSIEKTFCFMDLINEEIENEEIEIDDENGHYTLYFQFKEISYMELPAVLLRDKDGVYYVRIGSEYTSYEPVRFYSIKEEYIEFFEELIAEVAF